MPALRKPTAAPAKRVAASTDKTAKQAPSQVSRAKERAAGMLPLDPDKDSDLSLALREMIEGGETRLEVLHRIREKLANTTTRSGRAKPASTIMNHALNRAEAHGYRVVSSWRLEKIEGWVEPERPPAPPRKPRTVKAAPAKPVAAKKTAEKKTAPAKKTTAVRRVIVPPKQAAAKPVLKKPVLRKG